MSMKQKFIFTFGVDVDDPHRNGYHVIEANGIEAARKVMMERFGIKWAFVYDSEEAAGVEKYNLHEVK